MAELLVNSIYPGLCPALQFNQRRRSARGKALAWLGKAPVLVLTLLVCVTFNNLTFLHLEPLNA
jgi:hypothetical protein